MKSFLFYDLETTGLNKSFDQILQFAAIRTDTELNETDRYTINVRLRPDVIPSPYASITHRISVSDAAEGMCELEAVRHIHALVNTPGTISLGYNTLGFDDEFLRFSFYRNLLPPYTHQFANNCGRMDILPVAVLYYLYKPGVISWPEVDGRPTMKLEHISGENSLAEGRAHDAIVDVEATVELAKRFIREKEMWSYILGYFDKKTDTERFNTLPASFDTAAGIHTTGLMTDSKFGPDNLYQSPVLYIGNSIPYSNQSLWLRLDDPALTELTEDTIDENSYVLRKRFGEPALILPPAGRFMERLSGERMDIVTRNLEWLKSNTDVFYKIIKYYREYRYPDVENADGDAALYLNGFLSREEQQLCSKFHQASPERMLGMAGEFKKPSLTELALRIVMRNFDLPLPDRIQEHYRQHMGKINPDSGDNALIDYRGEKRMTPLQALADIGELRGENGLDDEQLKILDELEHHILVKYNRKL